MTGILGAGAIAIICRRIENGARHTMTVAGLQVERKVGYCRLREVRDGSTVTIRFEGGERH